MFKGDEEMTFFTPLLLTGKIVLLSNMDLEILAYAD